MLHIVKLDTLEADEDYEVIYMNLLRGGGFRGKIRHYEAMNGKYPEAVVGGDTVLLGGSRKDAFANDEFTNDLVERTKRWLADDVKLLGVCYGHQIVARALGARVGRGTWELGVVPLDLTDAGRAVFPELENGAGLQQVHQDEVFELPEGSTLLASSPNCRIQSFYKAGKYLCIQGHPEFSNSITLDQLGLMRGEAAIDAILPAGLARAQLPHSGPKFGKAMARLADPPREGPCPHV